MFLYENHPTPRGSGTISGQLLGGIAWIDGLAGHNCESSGVNCGAVEFTLRNDAPNQNAADFTLEAQSANGNHQLCVHSICLSPGQKRRLHACQMADLYLDTLL